MNWGGSISSFEFPQFETAYLWAAGILFFGVGDLVTRGLGFSAAGIDESNPVVELLIRQYGLLAMVGLKLAVFALCFAVWKLLPRPDCVGVPLGLAAMGILITFWNLQVLAATRLL